MPPWVSFLVFAVVVVGFIAKALGELHLEGLCTIYVRGGAVVRVRGRIPPIALNDVRDALAGSNAKGSIVVLPAGTAYPRVSFRGRFPDHTAQRVRNVLGNVPATRFR